MLVPQMAKEGRREFLGGHPAAPGPISCLHGDLWALGLFAADQEEAGAVLPRWVKSSVSLFVK